MKKRSIPISVFLTVITVGIYGIIWWFKVTEETIHELNYDSIDSAPMNLFYLIITLGLYYFWWNYKISTYISTIERRHNVEPDFWSPFMSLTFGIILHQSRINRLTVDNK